MAKRQPYTEPSEITEARRARLEQLMEDRGGVTRIAELSGINRVHLEKLIAPLNAEGASRRDILALLHGTIERLLTALEISDSAAQRELLIPEHLKSRWQTLREQPLGQKERDRTDLLDVVLTEPLVLTLQPGHLITVDQSNMLSGDILVRINGRHLVVPADAIPSNAEPLGQIVAADTLVRLPVPEP